MFGNLNHMACVWVNEKYMKCDELKDKCIHLYNLENIYSEKLMDLKKRR